MVPETASPPVFGKDRAIRYVYCFLGYGKTLEKQLCSDLIVLVLFFIPFFTERAAVKDMSTAIRL